MRKRCDVEFYITRLQMNAKEELGIGTRERLSHNPRGVFALGTICRPWSRSCGTAGHWEGAYVSAVNILSSASYNCKEDLRSLTLHHSTLELDCSEYLKHVNGRIPSVILRKFMQLAVKLSSLKRLVFCDNFGGRVDRAADTPIEYVMYQIWKDQTLGTVTEACLHPYASKLLARLPNVYSLASYKGRDQNSE